MHGRHKKTHLRRKMAPQRAHPVQKGASLLLIDQGNELESNLE